MHKYNLYLMFITYKIIIRVQIHNQSFAPNQKNAANKSVSDFGYQSLYWFKINLVIKSYYIYLLMI